MGGPERQHHSKMNYQRAWTRVYTHGSMELEVKDSRCPRAPLLKVKAALQMTRKDCRAIAIEHGCCLIEVLNSLRGAVLNSLRCGR